LCGSPPKKGDIRTDPIKLINQKVEIFLRSKLMFLTDLRSFGRIAKNDGTPHESL